MGAAGSLRCHLIRFGYVLVWQREALGENPDAFEQVHGAFKLRIGGVEHSFTILLFEALNAARGLLQLNVTLLLVRQGDDEIRGDAFLVDDLVTRGVVLGSGETQSGSAIRHR